MILQKRTFAAVERHRSFWPVAKILIRSQRVYSQPAATTVSFGERPELIEITVMIAWLLLYLIIRDAFMASTGNHGIKTWNYLGDYECLLYSPSFCCLYSRQTYNFLVYLQLLTGPSEFQACNIVTGDNVYTQ